MAYFDRSNRFDNYVLDECLSSSHAFQKSFMSYDMLFFRLRWNRLNWIRFSGHAKLYLLTSVVLFGNRKLFTPFNWIQKHAYQCGFTFVNYQIYTTFYSF